MTYVQLVQSVDKMLFIVLYCSLVKRKHANGLKHQTLPLMGATRPASVFCSLVPAGKRDVHTRNKGSQTAVIIRLSVSLFLKIRDASPPLVLAFSVRLTG